MKVKIAVLCFVILCTWYVYSVHNWCCPHTHNLYLLLCSYHWDIYEEPLSMIVVHSLRRDIQDSPWARIALFFSHFYVCYIHSRTKSTDCSKNLLWNTLLQTVERLFILAKCYVPKSSIASKKIVTFPSSPLIQSGSIATFISFNLMWRWESLRCKGMNWLTSVELVNSGRRAEKLSIISYVILEQGFLKLASQI